MGTKQVQMKFQVQATDKTSVNVTIVIENTQVFSGPLNHTVDSMVLEDVHYYTEPFSLAQFDLDVINTPADAVPQNTANGQWFVLMDTSITVTGGNICLQGTEANYKTLANVYGQPDPEDWKKPWWNLVLGTPDNFDYLNIGSTPEYNGVPRPDRYDYQIYKDTGCGALPLYDGETVTFKLDMSTYSSA